MAPDPTKTLSYMLGELRSDVRFLVDAERARQETDAALEARVLSLEQFKFKLVTIVATISASIGFIFSNVKEGAQWLKEVLS